MKAFQPALLLTSVRMMETILQTPQGRLEERHKINVQTIFSEIEQDCVGLGLNSSRVSAQKIIRLLSQPDSSFEKFSELVKEFQERIIDEMRAPRFFSMSDQEAEYYSNTRRGWEQIIVRFPNSVIDIEEAYKCFACSRYAAAVFHTLQVVEVGLIEFGRLIGVTDHRPGWTATTGKLKKSSTRNIRLELGLNRKIPRSWSKCTLQLMRSNSRGGIR